MQTVEFPVIRAPLSGNVPVELWLNMWNGNSFTINLGRSPDPTVELQVLTDVASYGRQLGRIGEALAVLMAHFEPKQPLTAPEKKALFDLQRLLADIEDVKEREKAARAAQR